VSSRTTSGLSMGTSTRSPVVTPWLRGLRRPRRPSHGSTTFSASITSRSTAILPAPSRTSRRTRCSSRSSRSPRRWSRGITTSCSVRRQDGRSAGEWRNFCGGSPEPPMTIGCRSSVVAGQTSGRGPERLAEGLSREGSGKPDPSSIAPARSPPFRPAPPSARGTARPPRATRRTGRPRSSCRGGTPRSPSGRARGRSRTPCSRRTAS
jgi:hypothetical protein